MAREDAARYPIDKEYMYGNYLKSMAKATERSNKFLDDVARMHADLPSGGADMDDMNIRKDITVNGIGWKELAVIGGAAVAVLGWANWPKFDSAPPPHNPPPPAVDTNTDTGIVGIGKE